MDCKNLTTWALQWWKLEQYAAKRVDQQNELEVEIAELRKQQEEIAQKLLQVPTGPGKELVVVLPDICLIIRVDPDHDGLGYVRWANRG